MANTIQTGKTICMGLVIIYSTDAYYFSSINAIRTRKYMLFGVTLASLQRRDSLLLKMAGEAYIYGERSKENYYS